MGGIDEEEGSRDCCCGGSAVQLVSCSGTSLLGRCFVIFEGIDSGGPSSFESSESEEEEETWALNEGRGGREDGRWIGALGLDRGKLGFLPLNGIPLPLPLAPPLPLLFPCMPLSSRGRFGNLGLSSK